MGFDTVRTASIVEQELLRLGLTPKTGIGKTGVLVDIVGKHPGKTVLLRAGMDALSPPLLLPNWAATPAWSPRHLARKNSVFLTLLRNLKRVLLGVLVLQLAGCGLQQKVSDGAVGAFNAVFYKQIKTLHLDFTARESLNSDNREHHPLSQPVMIRVFQLRERQAFDGAVYHQLADDAASVLKTTMLVERDQVLTLGGDVSLTMPMEAEGQYVAVVALFQQPDMTKNSWRLVLDCNDLDPDTARVIELGSQSLRLIVREKS